MVKNTKFNFEDEQFSTLFLILVSVGWISVSLGFHGTAKTYHKAVSAEVTAGLSPNTTSNQREVANSKGENKKSKVNAIAVNKNTVSERATTDLRFLTDKINNKVGLVVLTHEDNGPIEKLHVSVDYLLLTNGRPRVSSENSKIVAPAIIAFSAGKNVAAYIDHDATTPESYLTAIEKYIGSYNGLKVQRRLLTTAQNQLELTLEVQ